jgi:hypothetical protein
LILSVPTLGNEVILTQLKVFAGVSLLSVKGKTLVTISFNPI